MSLIKGHQITIEITGAEQITGMITDIDDIGLTIETAERERYSIPWDAIKAGQCHIIERSLLEDSLDEAA